MSFINIPLRNVYLLGLTAAMACGLCGCGTDERKGDAPVAQQDRIPAPAVIPAMEGTIRAVAMVTTDRPTPVEGYAVVAELPGTGSGEMPPTVRGYLEEYLQRQGAGRYSMGTERYSPSRILSSRQVAAVIARGVIPALSPRGTHFDLEVSALPNTQTTSIEHGLLWTCDLRIIGLDEDGPSTNAIAQGRGPVYCNPFTATLPDDSPNRVNVRTGRIMAGGTSMEDMPITLQLYTPSYRITGLVEKIINERFEHDPGYAAAQNDSVVTLTLPDEYRWNADDPHRQPRDPREFVDLIMHMYLSQDAPGFTEKKSAEVLAAINDPKTTDANRQELSLCLEGLGRTIISKLRQNYTAADPKVRYAVARAGAALQDAEADVVMEQFAQDDTSPFQMDAVKAIARNRNAMHATVVLARLLNSKNNSLRIAAYEGLISMQSPSIHSLAVGRKFYVDTVPSEGDPIIYVTQTGLPRVALIGHDLNVGPGVLYLSPDDLLTVNVAPNAAAENNQPATMPAGVADLPADSPATSAPAATAPQTALPPAVPVANPNLTMSMQPPPATQPAVPMPVQIYYRGLDGKQSVKMACNADLISLLSTLGDTPDPMRGDYNRTKPYVAASFQSLVYMLSAMCKEHDITAVGRNGLAEATFETQTAPTGASILAQFADQQRPEGPTPLAAPDKPAAQPVAMPPRTVVDDGHLPGEQR